MLYANALLRAEGGILRNNHRGQSGLWGYAISGDLPIVLLQISDSANVDMVRQVVQAHAYWRLKGLAVDLIIWNETTRVTDSCCRIRSWAWSQAASMRSSSTDREAFSFGAPSRSLPKTAS